MPGVTAALSMPDWIVILAVPSVVIGIFGYRWIHRVMQATAVIVGVSLVIMFVQGLRHGALPASETTLARPSAGLFLAGVALLVIDMLVVRPVRRPTTPATCPPGPTAGGCSGRSTPGTSWPPFVSCAIGAYLAALLPTLTPVGAVGKVSGKWALIIMACQPGQRQHLQRLHRGVPGAGVRQHVAPVQGRVGHRPAGPVPVRHGRRRGHRLLGYQPVRHQPVQLPRRAAGPLHPVVARST